MKNIVIGVVVFTLLFMGLGWLLVGQSEDTSPASFEITSEDQVYGNASSSAVLVEYSDFQCPACKAYYGFVNQIKADLGTELQIIYRHFPLRNIHKNAQLAAQAAEAAGVQGKFWEMHDALFDSQEDWSSLDDPSEFFLDLSDGLELDKDQFGEDMNSTAVIDKVNKDYQTGVSAGVNSTPSFFINGKKVNNPGSYDVFKSLIESNL